jgi:ABC-type polysaccharide/polyol phosphate export systems, permease component
MTAIAHTPSGLAPADEPTPSPGSTMARVFEHRLMAYRRTFRSSLFSSFVTPTLFLAAMGVGLGSYVDSGDSAALGGISYLAFLAPGLLAATAMNSASFEATFPVMSGLLWNRTFHAMYATPISARDITLGNLAFMAARLTLIATVFAAVIVLFGAATSPLIVLAIPAAVLTGMAFAAPIAAFSATQKTPEKFNALFRFVITPLFLFSGTFFPVSSLPPVLQSIAWLTPLYHGVSLTRGLSLGTISQDPLAAIVDVLFLSTFVIVGTFFAIRTIDARLVRG